MERYEFHALLCMPLPSQLMVSIYSGDKPLEGGQGREVIATAVVSGMVFGRWVKKINCNDTDISSRERSAWRYMVSRVVTDKAIHFDHPLYLDEVLKERPWEI